MAKKKLNLPLGVVPSLLAWWRKARVKGVIIGGLAVALRGRPRTTRDVDAIVFVDEEKWSDFLAKGARLSFQPRVSDPLPFAAQNRIFVVRHIKTGTDVDLSIGSHPIEHETLRRASNVNIGKIKVPVASAEDLLVLKAIANRPRDLIDMDGLLDRVPLLDIAYIRRQLSEIGPDLDEFDVGEEFERMLSKKNTRSHEKPAPKRKRKPTE